MEQPLLQLLNPVNWVRTYVSFGASIFTLLLSTFLLIAAIQSIVHIRYPQFVRYWLLLNVPTAWLIVLGRSVFERRLELEFEPSQSPERAAERQRTTDQAQLSRFLDELYAKVRINDRPRIHNLMKEHFALLDPSARQHDADLVLQRLRTWGGGAGAAYVRGCLHEQMTPAIKRGPEVSR